VRREAAAATFERWLEVIVHDIEELDAGEMLAVPVAWPAEGPDGRVRGEHACLLVVQRRDTAAGDDLSVAVCNTGDGAEYHPWRPASDTAQPQRARAVALHEISRSRLTCSAVWFAMFRALAFQRATSEASSKKAKRKKEKKQKSKDTEIVAAAAHELRESDSSDENADDKDAERRRSGKDAGMPSRRQGARLLYQTLLPFMNRRAFLANVPAGGGSELQDTCPEVVFQTEPFSGDWSRVACALEAVRVCLLWSGLAAGEVAHVLLLLKWGLASVATSELAQLRSLPSCEAAVLKAAVQHLATDAADTASAGALPEQQVMQLARFVASSGHKIEWLARRGDALEALAPTTDGIQPGAGVLVRGGADVWKGSAAFPLFGRLRQDGIDVEKLAGAAVAPPAVLPIELSLVADTVSSPAAAEEVLRRAARCCILLAHQRERNRPTFLLRLALIKHVATEVLPRPRPIGTRREGCFWASGSMTRATQTEILRLLALMAQHYAAAALSVPPDEMVAGFDAARIVTMACLAAVADAVARASAKDVVSEFSAHYAGFAEGPPNMRPYAFAVGPLRAEAEALRLLDPFTAAALTQAMDYLISVERSAGAAHTCFRFEANLSLGAGDTALIDQLCIQAAFPRDRHAAYIAGDDPELLQEYPELRCLRDIVFLLKAMMVTDLDMLPPARAWDPTDVALKWSVGGRTERVASVDAGEGEGTEDKDDDAGEGGEEGKVGAPSSVTTPAATPGSTPTASPAKPAQSAGSRQKDERALALEVRGFGRKLECAAYSRPQGKQRSALFRAAGAIRALFGGCKPRRPPSGADPSLLAGCKIVTEDDVLHVHKLPDFGGRLRPHESELLLQILTAPYLRIPLLLHFLSFGDRIKALSSVALQQAVDAALFERGEWLAADAEPGVEMVPQADRAALSTPAGLLWNELLRNPSRILGEAQRLLKQAMALDTGK
jgi:hypothetical protein